MSQIESLEELQNQSMLSMYGLVDRNASGEENVHGPAVSLIPTSSCCCKHKITTVACAIEAINSVYNENSPNYTDIWTERKAKIYEILNKIDFAPTELGKYTYFDNAVPYTRNLIHTDHKNYTLLLLCWGAGRESKIHDHPCQGCFVRTISGCISESIYRVTEDKEIVFSRSNSYPAGKTSFMSDTIGLHKIGNPDAQQGAISMHLYVPPYEKCKVRFCLSSLNISSVLSTCSSNTLLSPSWCSTVRCDYCALSSLNTHLLLYYCP